MQHISIISPKSAFSRSFDELDGENFEENTTSPAMATHISNLHDRASLVIGSPAVAKKKLDCGIPTAVAASTDLHEDLQQQIGCPFDPRCSWKGSRRDCHIHLSASSGHKLPIAELEANSFTAEIIVDPHDKTRRAGVVVRAKEGRHLLWHLESTKRADGELRYGVLVSDLTHTEPMNVTITAMKESLEITWRGSTKLSSTVSHNDQMMQGNGLSVLWPTHQPVFHKDSENDALSLWFETLIEPKTPQTTMASTAAKAKNMCW